MVKQMSKVIDLTRSQMSKDHEAMALMALTSRFRTQSAASVEPCPMEPVVKEISLQVRFKNAKAVEHCVDGRFDALGAKI